MGSGPAVEFAARERVAGLALISPFMSAFRVLTRVKLLPFDRFDNIAKIGFVHAPILIFHGTRDEVIPFAHGQNLFAAAPEPKRSVWIEGAGHNDIFEVAGARVLSELKIFAQNLSAPPPWANTPRAGLSLPTALLRVAIFCGRTTRAEFSMLAPPHRLTIRREPPRS